MSLNFSYTVSPDQQQGIVAFNYSFVYHDDTSGDSLRSGEVFLSLYDYRSPSLANPGDQTSSDGEWPDLTLSATDPDGNPLTYSAGGLPYGLSLDPVYGNITGSIDAYYPSHGPYHVTVTASNGSHSDSQSFDWNVTPAAPSIDNANDARWDDVNNAEGDSVAIPIQASDPDGLALTYDAIGLPPGLSIDASSGIISGTVAPGDDIGTPYDVTVSVSNGSKTTTLEFPWTITHVSLTAPADRTDVAGGTVSLPAQASAPDGATLTYSADGLLDGLAIDPDTGMISGTIDPSAAGGIPWTVTLSVTDGTETADRTFQWTVDPTVIPAIDLANPGDQVNFTNDVIGLPVQGTTTGPDNLHYVASGLPDGLEIDSNTGVIQGMDDDCNAHDGTVYIVTVTATDDYGQTTSQTFAWRFNAPTSPPGGQGDAAMPGPSPNPGGLAPPGGGVLTNGDGVTPPVPGLPGEHPQTEARTDRFDIGEFWNNVEKFPGGTAAEAWFSEKKGRVEWAWLGITTLGRWEEDTNGNSIPVVYIPQRYNEAYASEAFVNNITQSWVTGFADHSKVPTDGNPASWQAYIKDRTQAMGQVVTTGAELYLSGLSIASEGADWVVTINDIATAPTAGAALIQSIALLPFISSSSIRVLSKGLNSLNATPVQQQLIRKFLKDYKRSGFVSRTIFTDATTHGGAIVLQRNDIIFNEQQVVSMMGTKIGQHNAPWAHNPLTGQADQIHLHHVDQYPQNGGVVAEIFSHENVIGNALHPGPNGAKHDAAWTDFRNGYWFARLQQGIDRGWVPRDLINKYRQRLISQGFTLP